MPLITQNTAPGSDRARKLRGGYLLLAIGGVAAAALVTACSGGASGSGGSSSPSGSPSGAAKQSTGGGSGFGGGPAASGLIAAVETGSIEVQSQSAGQLTVDYTSSTRITQTVTGTLADITVGSCVVAIDASAASSSSASSSTSTAPTTITVTPAVNGSCTRTGGSTGGGFGGNRPSGSFTPGANRPSGFPTNRPSGSGFSRGNFATAITSGKVTAVSGDTITVDAVSFDRGGSSGSPAASPTTTPKTITVGSSTKITKTAAATSSALKVGLCASAQGTTDTSGTVSATSIALTSPDSSGSCETSGFGGRLGGGSFGGGAGGAGTGATGANG